MNPQTRALRGAVRAYQLIASPVLGGQCRFYPSCSAYAMEALAVHGAARGSLLAAKRVFRCHPWHPGGIDPVPPADPQQDEMTLHG
ncbi:membrane protein insertion efficiency factor YidD [Acidiphilium acidophilum]|uniref:Putative membrane protein insertion efficiency factor n=1 Tax=Acidiphilium acidophilum TaxID=76588 RepID=A0AAW9DMG7_ACIAO|nr:membrane protein insertion efficiency factor YidD [Acidiphilium acidophilum]MDX5929858.1 membrane protein insertion efficiency factor YidD [Acidiphilium acidophilum]